MKDILVKLKYLLSKSQRTKLIILTVLLFFGMILEIMGLGVLVPVLSMILDSDFIYNNQYTNNLIELLGDISHEKFIYLFLAFTILLYSIKTIYLMFLTYKQNNFLSFLTASITYKLFKGYLEQPYMYHINNNAARFIKNLQTEVIYFNSFCLSLINIIIEGSLAIAVIGTLIYIEPVGAILLGLFFGLLSYLFFQFTKRKLSYWGEKREFYDNKLSKTSIEGLNGIKDLMVLNREQFYKSSFNRTNLLKAKIIANNNTVSQLPRFYLEMISVVGLISFITVMLLLDHNVTDLMTTLGVFVAATFRLTPSLNRIIASLQSIKYYKSSIQTIYDDVVSFKNENEPYTNEIQPFKYKISFKDFSFKYSEDSQYVLKNINLNINKGEIVGFIGESGSGKSSLIDCLIGLLPATEGEIHVDGKNIKNNGVAWRNNIGYVSQQIYLIDDNIIKNVAFGIKEEDINHEKVIDALKSAQILSFINKLPNGLNTIVGENGVQLSGGQRQRIGIARALYHNPQILILDEATASLDVETENKVMASVNLLKREKTIIKIAHRISTLDDCDIIYKVTNKNIEIYHNGK